MKIKSFFLQIGLFCLLLQGGSVSAKELTIGTISDEPVKEIRTFLPFSKYLARQLEGFGIDDGSVVIARDIDHMAALIRQGKVDLFVDSPLVALAINAKAGSKLLARRWKKGIAEYHSVVFVRNDSDIKSVADLAGHVIAFEESFSSSGHLLPRITLEGLGLQLRNKIYSQSDAPLGQADYVFTGDDENTIEWVLRSRVDAGAMSMNNFTKYATTGQAELRIILATEEIPRHSISIASSLPDSLASALETVLLSMQESEEGLGVLEGFERTTKFDTIPEDTVALLKQLQNSVVAVVSDD